MSAGGNATFNGSIFSGGNVVVPNGNGIDFSATGNISGTSSELLSDYEEGTWTPNIAGNTSYTTQTGTYVRVGDLVHCTALIQINTIGTGSVNTVYGLPFTSINNGATQGAVNVMYYANIATSMIWLTGYVNNNNTIVYFSGNSASATTIGHNTQTMFQNSTRVDFNVTYRVA